MTYSSCATGVLHSCGDLAIAHLSCATAGALHSCGDLAMTHLSCAAAGVLRSCGDLAMTHLSCAAAGVLHSCGDLAMTHLSCAAAEVLHSCGNLAVTRSCCVTAGVSKSLLVLCHCQVANEPAYAVQLPGCQCPAHPQALPYVQIRHQGRLKQKGGHWDLPGSREHDPAGIKNWHLSGPCVMQCSAASGAVCIPPRGDVPNCHPRMPWKDGCWAPTVIYFRYV